MRGDGRKGKYGQFAFADYRRCSYLRRPEEEWFRFEFKSRFKSKCKYTLPRMWRRRGDGSS
jgi:hypothetical protein